jgi:hypothetical protein
MISAMPSIRSNIPNTNGTASVAAIGELNSKIPMRRLYAEDEVADPAAREPADNANFS